MKPQINFQNLKPVTIAAQTVSTRLELSDYLGTMKVRWGIGRNNYRVEPGLYKVGKPTADSQVMVSANYKLSFDHLRKNLKGIDSHGMILMASDADGRLVFVSPTDAVKNGSEIK